MAVVEITVTVGGRTLTDFDAAFASITRDLEREVDAAGPKLRTVINDTMSRIAAQAEVINQVGPTSLATLEGGGVRGLVAQITSEGVGGASGTLRLTGFAMVEETDFTYRKQPARFVAIPLPAALDGRGMPLRQSARDWDKTFVARSRRGNLLLFRRVGRSITPLYLLRVPGSVPPQLDPDAAYEGALPYFERRALAVLDKILGA